MSITRSLSGDRCRVGFGRCSSAPGVRCHPQGNSPIILPRTPRKTLTREPKSLRFTSSHTATEEGNLKVSVENEAPRNMQYSLQLVNEDGNWLITSIREWPSTNADLMDLEWLIGSWAANRPDAEVQATYEWFGSKAYIRSTMTVGEKERTLTAMQMIGVDPNTDKLRIVTFESDGGFAEGTCTAKEIPGTSIRRGLWPTAASSQQRTFCCASTTIRSPGNRSTCKRATAKSATCRRSK